MKLRKIISGGQTGADREALNFAVAIGLETGGTAPKGWRTEKGPAPNLAYYGLVESDSSEYAVRTRQNVKDSDVTLWFGNCNTAGYGCTKFACEREGKLFYVNPTKAQLEFIAHKYEVVNVAGNRASTNPKIEDIVHNALQVFSVEKGA